MQARNSRSPFLRRILAHHQLDDSDETARALAALVKRNPSDEFSQSQWELGRSYFQRRIAEFGISGDLLLDLGCGTGTWSLSAAAYFNRVVGFDVRQDRIESACEIRKLLGVENVEFECRDITSLPFPDESVDSVFIYNVLPYVPGWQRLICEAHRVLRPSGTLLCSWADIGMTAFSFVEAIALGRGAQLAAVARALRLCRRPHNGLYLRAAAVRRVAVDAGFELCPNRPQDSAHSLPLLQSELLGFPFFIEMLARRRDLSAG